MQRFLAVLLAGAAALVSIPFVSAQYNEYRYQYSSGAGMSSSHAPVAPGVRTGSASSLAGGNRIDDCIWRSAGVTAGTPLADGMAKEQRVMIDRLQLRDCLTGAQGSGVLTMQRLWIDRAVWLRQHIVALTVGSPDDQSATDRLLQNSNQLGEAFALSYGAPAGQQLTALLNEHLAIATQRLEAAGSGKEAAFREADDRWHQNADALAALLSDANPAYWPKDRLSALFGDEMDLLTNVSIARLQNAWSEDVAVFDRLLDNAVAIAGLLSSGADGGTDSSGSSSSSSHTSIFDPQSSSSSSSPASSSGLFNSVSSSSSGYSNSSGLFGPGSSSSSSSVRSSSGLFGPGSSSSSSRSTSSSGLFGPASSSSAQSMY